MLPAVTIPAGQLAVLDAVRRPFGAPTFATVALLVVPSRMAARLAGVVIPPGRTILLARDLRS